jgi:hypothetical protein
MATDADVDMGGVSDSDDIRNIAPSGTKRRADGQPKESTAPIAPPRIKVGKLLAVFLNASRIA